MTKTLLASKTISSQQSTDHASTTQGDTEIINILSDFENDADSESDGFVSLRTVDDHPLVDTTSLITPENVGDFLPSFVPPWIPPIAEDIYNYFYSPVLQRLHNEIVMFADFVKPTPSEIDDRTQLVERLRDAVYSLFPDAKLECFGSYATGSYLPFGDMDFVLFHTPSEKYQSLIDKRRKAFEFNMKQTSKRNKIPVNECQYSKYMFNMLSVFLQKDDLISDLEIVSQARIPVMKFVDKATGIQCDITLNSEASVESVNFIKSIMTEMPQMQCLTLVIKYFLYIRGLNDTFTGGAGSFMIQCMVISLLQHHPGRFIQNANPALGCKLNTHCNLGILLYSFFRMYCFELNYTKVRIHVDDHGSISNRTGPPAGNAVYGALSLINPLDPDHDIGANTYNIHSIRQAFLFGYSVIVNHIKFATSGPRSEPITSTVLSELLVHSVPLRQLRSPLIRLNVIPSGVEVVPMTPPKTPHDIDVTDPDAIYQIMQLAHTKEVMQSVNMEPGLEVMNIMKHADNEKDCVHEGSSGKKRRKKRRNTSHLNIEDMQHPLIVIDSDVDSDDMEAYYDKKNKKSRK